MTKGKAGKAYNSALPAFQKRHVRISSTDPLQMDLHLVHNRLSGRHKTHDFDSFPV